MKQRRLEALLRAAMGRHAPRVLPMLAMPVGPDGMPWGFRHKVAFVFGPAPDGRGLVMGHFARGTGRIVPVQECPVHSERGNRIAFALRDRLAAAGAGGVARHVIVRTTADQSAAVAMLVVSRNAPSLRAPLRALLGSRDRPEGLLLNVHDRPGPFMVGPETRRLAGSEHVVEDALGPEFLASPASFFQTNVVAAGILLRLVAEALPAQRALRILDLYSGGGLFAIDLARRGHRVTAVEESREAIRDAAENRRRNGVSEPRLRLIRARVEEAVVRLRGRFDAVVLDPPRQGCPRAVLEAVGARLRPRRIVLVSCAPEALARELAQLARLRYASRPVQPVDMFPHTPHIEAVAVLDVTLSSHLKR